MTTPQHTRTALSEIPSRLEQLSFASTPTNQMAAEPTEASVPNPVIFVDSYDDRNSVYNVTSPDEIIIRQRGRRRFTLAWSPDKLPLQSLFQKTPTKSSTQMTLRSSPRKRIMPDILKSPAKSSIDHSIKTLASVSGARTTRTDTPYVKKLKLDEKPIAQTNFNIDLQTLLKGLSHGQLVDIIGNCVEKNRGLEESIRRELPMPDIRYMEEELLINKRNIFKSLPTSRLCKKTDSSAFAKASIHLSSVKAAILNHTRKLNESSHWDALLDYVLIAWDYVRGTPVWDNDSHNSIRRQCFKVLACHCVAALKYGGLRLGMQRLHNLEIRLRDWSKDHDDILPCLNALNRTLHSRMSI